MDRAASRDYAELAPLVLEAAGAGDALAAGLLDQAGAEASRMIAALRAAGAERVCLMGGLAATLVPHLTEAARATLVQPMGDALDGALLLARNAHRKAAGR
jgi:glucosamine kinase